MKHISLRLFTEEFKRVAIRLVTEQQLNVAATGRQNWTLTLNLSARRLQNLNVVNLKPH